MVFLIDQSGKIEQTNKNTIVCLSNSHWDACQVNSKTKRQIQEIFRRNGQIRNYVLFTFCACLSLLIKRNIYLKTIIIDREYFGREAIIKEIVLEMLKEEKNAPYIKFKTIGRRVNAHKFAYLIYSKKLKSKITLTLNDIFKAIKKTEVGKRLKDT